MLLLVALGTFFGMKPYGIILFVYKLFISEFKSQVFRILHDVLFKWELNSVGTVSSILFSIYIHTYIKKVKKKKKNVV